MTSGRERLRGRLWADLIAIAAGVYLLIVAEWAPALVAPESFAVTGDLLSRSSGHQ